MEIDPYYILGVTRNDSVEKITREYRLNAKKYHPDKVKEDSREYASRQFKILKDAYNTILSEKRKGADDSTRETFKKYNSNIKVEAPEKMDQDVFNKKFQVNRKKQPNDFGYQVSSRLGAGDITVDPSKVNWGEKMNEYNNFDYKPVEIINKDNFNNTDFNKMFEFTWDTSSSVKESDSRGLVTQTRDGFIAANTTIDVGGYASVSSWNGLMIVGDNLGESGVGYDTNNYGDYKQSFNGGMNPIQKLDDSALNYKTKMEKSGVSKDVLSKREYTSLLKEREETTSILNNPKYDKSYSQYNIDMEKKESDSFYNKLENDTKFIEQYSNLYPKELVEQAKKGLLDSSNKLKYLE